MALIHILIGVRCFMSTSTDFALIELVTSVESER